MITFLNLLRILIPVAGGCLGASVGYAARGPAGWAVGALIGFVLLNAFAARIQGWFLRREIRAMRRKLAPLSAEELRGNLATSLTPNYFLLELKARGEDISGELETVLQMLEADASHRRIVGWAALRSAFPQIALLLTAYFPTRSAPTCREQVAELRSLLARGAAP